MLTKLIVIIINYLIKKRLVKILSSAFRDDQSSPHFVHLEGLYYYILYIKNKCFSNRDLVGRLGGIEILLHCLEVPHNRRFTIKALTALKVLISEHPDNLERLMTSTLFFVLDRWVSLWCKTRYHNFPIINWFIHK